MTDTERKEMMILSDTIKGEINRMCVTDSLVEFDTMCNHAKKNIMKLQKIIYGCRFRNAQEDCNE